MPFMDFRSSLSALRLFTLEVEKQFRFLKSFHQLRGVECSLDKDDNGSDSVRKIIAELRKPLGELTKKDRPKHASFIPTVLWNLFSRLSIILMNSCSERMELMFSDSHDCWFIKKRFNSPWDID